MTLGGGLGEGGAGAHRAGADRRGVPNVASAVHPQALSLLPAATPPLPSIPPPLPPPAAATAGASAGAEEELSWWSARSCSAQRRAEIFRGVRWSSC